MQMACYFHSVRLEKFKCMHTRERDDRERQQAGKIDNATNNKAVEEIFARQDELGLSVA